MSTYYLASASGGVPSAQPEIIRQMRPVLMLESANSLLKIVLDDSDGWIWMDGSTGLDMPLVSVVSENVPGVHGAVNTDVRYEARPIFLPIYYGAGNNQLAYFAAMDKLRRLIDPVESRSFKLVGTSERGTRELNVTYTGGLEGIDGGMSSGLAWRKIGLTAVAHDPFARQRTDRVLEFRVATTAAPFLGAVGGTDAPFPGSLSTGAVIGTGMAIDINSEVPVYPVLELVGPMDSFSGTLSPGVVNQDGTVTLHEDHIWDVSVPAGVPSGSTLRLVTDPRIRSIRLNGALAASQVARGSALRPFYPGQNVLNVVAPGGDENTRIRLSWRDQHLSLW